MIRLWLAALALALLPAAPATAGTPLKYIAGAPEITLEVPDGWTAEEERYHIVHPLEFRPKKGEVPYRVQMFYFPVGDTEHPRRFVRELAEQQAQDDNLTKAAYEPPQEQRTDQKVPVTMQVLEGRRNGAPHRYIFLYFVAGKHGYVLAVNGPSATLDGAKNVTEAIMNSVRPLPKK